MIPKRDNLLQLFEKCEVFIIRLDLMKKKLFLKQSQELNSYFYTQLTYLWTSCSSLTDLWAGVRWKKLEEPKEKQIL